MSHAWRDDLLAERLCNYGPCSFLQPPIPLQLFFGHRRDELHRDHTLRHEPLGPFLVKVKEQISKFAHVHPRGEGNILIRVDSDPRGRMALQDIIQILPDLRCVINPGIRVQACCR